MRSPWQWAMSPRWRMSAILGACDRPKAWENGMSEKSEWRKALREPNAMGWIAFFGLVVAIGAATLIFGSAPEPKGAKPASAASGTPQGPQYPK